MKRFLSFLLVLSTLLCLIPVAATAEIIDAEAPEEEAVATHVDLYVKNGLVALFDAYSATAGEEGVKATSWTPVDLYGKEGYTSYVDPAAFAAGTIVDGKTYLSFRWADGYLESYNRAAVTTSTMDTSAYLDLSPLIATLGGTATYAVQEVIQYVRPSNPAYHMTFDGTTVTANWTDAATGGYEGFSGNFYGCLNFGPCYWQKTNHIINQPIETVLAPTYKNIFIGTEYYTGTAGKQEVVDAEGNVLGSFNYATGALGVNERTVTRLSMTEEEGGTYTAAYSIHWLWATESGNDYAPSYAGQSASTTLKLLNGMPSRIYAVRIYDRALTAADYSQNHFADLCGFYKIGGDKLAKILALSQTKLDGLYQLTADFAICKLSYSDPAYSANQAKLERIIDSVLTGTDYRDLYVKEGLVALFDAHDAVPGSTALTSFAPVDFYGIAGYEDYLDPSTYTYAFKHGDAKNAVARFTWYATDGGIYPKTTNTANTSSWTNYTFLDLDDLGALLAEKHGNLYTVQEVFSHNVKADPIIENGVVTNYNTVKINYGRTSAAWIGSFNFGGSQLSGNWNSTTGDANNLNMLVEQIQFGTAYSGHWSWRDASYGTVRYDTLVDTAGTALPNTHNGTTVAGYYVGAGSISIERTISRLGYRESSYQKDTGTTDESGNKIYTTVPTYYSAFYVHFVKKPWHRTGSSNWVTSDGTFEKNNDSLALHTATKLHLAADHATVHSIRIYAGRLSASEINQNHMADLVAYYGISLEDILSLEPASLALFIDSVKEIELSGKKDRSDGSKFVSTKAQIQALLDAAKTESDTYYRNFYVTDGLVALFDAHTAKAGDGSPTTLAPVPLAGDAYASYADTNLYTPALSGSWTYVNGALRPQNASTYLNLNTLGALLDTTYTVQEILGFPTASAPVVKEDNTIDHTGTAGFGGYGNSGIGGLRYGTLRPTWHSSAHHTGVANITRVFFEQLQFGAAYAGNAAYVNINVFNTPDYNVSFHADVSHTYTHQGVQYTATGWYVGGPMTMERTTFRLGVTETEADGTVSYASKFKLYFPFAISFRGAGTMNEREYSITTEKTNRALHYSTELRLAGAQGDIYSIRIYDSELSKAEIAQNHFADLAGFYDADADLLREIRSMTDSQKAHFYNALLSVKMAYTGKDGADYESSKRIYEDALADAMRVIAYRDLYEKEGLVALFDAMHVIASDTKATAWAPVDFYGEQGYDDYLDPSLYTAELVEVGGRTKWVAQSGGYQSIVTNTAVNLDSAEAYLNLDTLGGMLDFSQGVTVQEIASHTMQPIVLDGVLTNYSSLVSPMKMSASKIGPLTHGGGQMKASKPDGVNLLAGVVCEQLVFADVGYASHLTYRNAAYGAQKYTSLTADDGTDLSGYYVGSPFTLSRSITVRSVNNGDGTYTSSATFRHQLDRPYNRAVSVGQTAWGSWTGIDESTWQINRTSSSDKHTSTALHLAANGAVNRAIRIYAGELTETQINRNHFVDLLAVYKIDYETIMKVKTISNTTFAELINSTSDLMISPYAANTADWEEDKAEFTAILNEYFAKEEALAANVLSVAGITYRVTGDFGIRSVFAVSRDAIAELEACGYTVSFGAIMAIKEHNGELINASAEELTVTVDENGDLVLASGKDAQMVCSDGGMQFLTEALDSFGFTTTFKEDGSQSDYYDTTILYRGFTVVRNASGDAVYTVYDDLSLTNEALNTPSLKALHQYVLDTQADALPDEYVERLEAVLS